MGNMNDNKKTILTLECIGIDDFSCPTYQDQFGHLWKDLNLGQSETPDLYSVTGNEPDGEPIAPIRYEHVFTPKPYQNDNMNSNICCQAECGVTANITSDMEIGAIPDYMEMIRNSILIG